MSNEVVNAAQSVLFEAAPKVGATRIHPTMSCPLCKGALRQHKHKTGIYTQCGNQKCQWDHDSSVNKKSLEDFAASVAKSKYARRALKEEEILEEGKTLDNKTLALMAFDGQDWARNRLANRIRRRVKGFRAGFYRLPAEDGKLRSVHDLDIAIEIWAGKLTYAEWENQQREMLNKYKKDQEEPMEDVTVKAAKKVLSGSRKKIQLSDEEKMDLALRAQHGDEHAEWDLSQAIKVKDGTEWVLYIGPNGEESYEFTEILQMWVDKAKQSGIEDDMDQAELERGEVVGEAEDPNANRGPVDVSKFYPGKAETRKVIKHSSGGSQIIYTYIYVPEEKQWYTDYPSKSRGKRIENVNQFVKIDETKLPLGPAAMLQSSKNHEAKNAVVAESKEEKRLKESMKTNGKLVARALDIPLASSAYNSLNILTHTFIVKDPYAIATDAYQLLSDDDASQGVDSVRRYDYRNYTVLWAKMQDGHKEIFKFKSNGKED